MRDFLIDTNIWEYWFNPAREPEHSHVLKRVSELNKLCEKMKSPFRVWMSSVTWGELEYGYQVQTNKEHSLETPFRQFIHKIGPKEKKKKGLRPEQLIDPVTSLQLRIQENDLWIVSQAFTRDFILVTNDRKSLQPLLEVASDELHTENWAAENT